MIHFVLPQNKSEDRTPRGKLHRTKACRKYAESQTHVKLLINSSYCFVLKQKPQKQANEQKGQKIPTTNKQKKLPEKCFSNVLWC